MENNIRCRLAYVGTRYFGFQKTTAGPSIEEELEKALSKILQHPVTIQAASRTDRGVHAEGQVVNFFTEKQVDLSILYGALRGLLPKDISPLSLTFMDRDFHPTVDAKQKHYVYQVCNSPTQLPFHREFSWHFYYPTILEKMEEAKELFVGENDFSALTTIPYEDPVRKVTKIEIVQEGTRLFFHIYGENFLYKMVRTLVGTLAYVGAGKISLEEIPLILEKKERSLSGITAPAHGLTLKQVFY